MGVLENPTFFKANDLKIQLDMCFDQLLPASPAVPAQEAHQHELLGMAQHGIAGSNVHASTTTARQKGQQAEEEAVTKP